MIFINKYATAQEVQDAVDNQELSKPYVAYITGEDKIDWNSKFIDYAGMYLTIEALEDGDFYVRKADIGYSVNGADWETTTGETALALNTGDTVRFKGTSSDATGLFRSNTIAYNVYGNIESLGHGDDFSNVTQAGYFESLFQESNIVSAENLILPATTLAGSCYRQMFYDCTNLAAAPVLPATTLEESCYRQMFYNCTSLTTAPELPATTLAVFCYRDMFYGCTSLTAAPALPATTLAYYCYGSMFRGCTSLTAAPELPVTTLGDSCYSNMFNGCSSLTTAPELPATTLNSSCYDSMFRGCTSLTTAPALPATRLVGRCYISMFQGCTSLNYIKCLATNISAIACTSNWAQGVASTGTFIKAASMTGWETGSSDGIPNGWTVVEE